MQTKHLTLVLQTKEECLAMIEALSPDERAQVSPLFLARVHALTAPDPWTCFYTLIHRDTGASVGSAGFKGPPDEGGAVELAYGIHPDHQNQGYATEAAQALTTYALQTGQVRLVRAHTLPNPNASTRVLTKCGFRHLGEVIDPEDGPVWRWEILP